MKKVIGAVLAGLLALCGLFSAGCAKREETAVRYLRIGVVEYNANDTFISELVSCLKADFRDLSREDLNISVTVKDAAGSQRTENSCVEELIDGGCEVLCVNLVDRATTSSIIDQAMEHDVPIVFFNREPVREDLMQWEKLYYVGSDPTQSGQMQGELASDRILSDPPVDRDGDGKIQFVLLEGEPGHQDAIIRTESSVSTIRDRGIALEKRSYSIANWNRAQAMTRMSQLITQYGNSIELVLANNDDMALGAIDAYDRKNITEADRPAVFGTDGTKEGLTAIEDGTMAGTVYNDKEGQALAMAKLAVALAEDGDLSGFDFTDGRYLYLPYQKVTKENAAAFRAKQQEEN